MFVFFLSSFLSLRSLAPYYRCLQLYLRGQAPTVLVPSCYCAFYYSSAVFSSCGLTVQSLFTKLGNMVVGHVKRSRNETRNYWPNGGAIAVNWKCKLWSSITHALFKLLPWNFDTHMRLLMLNNFRSLTFDLWPLDQPPFWIIWKTVKIELVLGFLSNSNTNFYTWTLDLCRRKIRLDFS